MSPIFAINMNKTLNYLNYVFYSNSNYTNTNMNHSHNEWQQ